MEDFTITTRFTTKEYAKIIFVELYKKPGFILATLLGFYYEATVMLNYFQVISYYSATPYFEIFCGLFLLLAPTLIVIMSVRQFISNPSFQNDMKYTFSENGFTIKGLTFKGEFLWTHIIKQKELNNYLILYHTKKMGNFIDKRKLTLDQLQFIKTKVRQK